jgi:hypothetical protein
MQQILSKETRSQKEDLGTIAVLNNAKQNRSTMKCVQSSKIVDDLQNMINAWVP